MIVEYHRPLTVAQALDILSRPAPKCYPLGGGSVLSHQRGEDFAVVDLQNLGWSSIQARSDRLIIGSTTRLQDIVESNTTPTWLKDACRREVGRNLREMGTIAGSMMCANGRSPLAIALLAADIQAHILPGDEILAYDRIVAERANVRQPWLISQVLLDSAVAVKFEFIARSPADLPVLGIALAQWPNGRMRAAVGGFGAAPLLAYDGNDPQQVTEAVVNALKNSGDEWASKEYRQSIAPAVVNRLF